MATNKTGSRGQLRTTPPTATTLVISSHQFFPPSLLRMQLSTEPPSSEGGYYGWRPRLTVMINRKDYYGRNCNPHFWFRRGLFCGSASMCEWIFLQVFSPPSALPAPKGEWCFPTWRAISAERGVTVHRGADHVELPRLARPKGCFDTSAEWS